MHVASLHIHPVKGMRAVDLSTAQVESRGLEGDRRWLVVNADGKFLTQRSHPQLATLAPQLTIAGLTLSAEKFGEIEVATPDGAARRDVVIWDAPVNAAVADPDASAFLSDLMGEESHLVYMDDKALRLKTSNWTPAPVPVSFADAFPVLVTTAGSLVALNRDIEKHGGKAIPMARFRPNIVVDCEEAWAEDGWARLQIGALVFDLVKPSDRCIVTTTDQHTGARMGKEPLAALARIHRSADPRIKGVIFGENAVPLSAGRIAVGDSVEVLKARS
ncbi:MOSC domain-containing protein [Hyphococcus sp.]|uniref:MOSC domain-containing protein n=1 Tax=Hyphococcus sp. TaxID=2038636 RepID=UPI00207DAAA8|nr:MAG: MOSC domain-containing protein [Marinicaulis sp.]